MQIMNGQQYLNPQPYQMTPPACYHQPVVKKERWSDSSFPTLTPQDSAVPYRSKLFSALQVETWHSNVKINDSKTSFFLNFGSFKTIIIW